MRFNGSRTSGGRLLEGNLDCCRESWKVRDGLPRLFREDWVKGTDRLMRALYNGMPSLHNPAVRFLIPVLQLGGNEAELRGGYIRRLELTGLRAGRDRPLRILEVGVGAGANIPLIMDELGLQAGEVEYWGLDLSIGMLGVCRRLVAKHGYDHVRLMVGDAHNLPFEDNSFDRAFHVGGIGGFNDPARALAEMARVALPDTPIVVVDEQLDPSLEHNLWQRIMFRAATFYDDNPHCPVEDLPEGATDILEEHVSRFYYSMRFRMPETGNDR